MSNVGMLRNGSTLKRKPIKCGSYQALTQGNPIGFASSTLLFAPLAADSPQTGSGAKTTRIVGYKEDGSKDLIGTRGWLYIAMKLWR
jgi:hypothetical protein